MTESKLRKNIVGKNIRKLRIERGYSQRDLVRECELLGYPISQNMISRIENGKRRVTDMELLVYMDLKEDGEIVGLF